MEQLQGFQQGNPQGLKPLNHIVTSEDVILGNGNIKLVEKVAPEHLLQRTKAAPLCSAAAQHQLLPLTGLAIHIRVCAHLVVTRFSVLLSTGMYGPKGK